MQIEGGDNDSLFDTVNLLEDNMTIVLGAGIWTLDNQVTVRGATGISIVGQGMDETVLDFALEAVQTNGIDAVGDQFLVQDLTVKDAKKDGIRVEDSNGVVMRRVRATWTDEQSSENGAYGLYPSDQNVPSKTASLQRRRWGSTLARPSTPSCGATPREQRGGIGSASIRRRTTTSPAKTPVDCSSSTCPATPSWATTCGCTTTPSPTTTRPTSRPAARWR